MTTSKKHENFAQYIQDIDPNSVFVEIGSERLEGSTIYLSDLAKEHSTKLVSVDIEDKSIARWINDKWQFFYESVRDPSWPDNPPTIDHLPTHIKQECIDMHGWAELRAGVIEKYSYLENVLFFQGPGSDWCRDYGKQFGRPISLLYLDNYDYIWNIDNISETIQKQIVEYKEFYGIDMDNQGCQVEHLKQMINIYPHLTPDCLVGLDDTYQYNGCWIGKSGAVVVYLLALGWDILLIDGRFVLMQRPKNSWKKAVDQ